MKLKWSENSQSKPGQRCIDIYPAGRLLSLAYIQSSPEHGYTDEAAIALAKSICENCEIDLSPDQ